MQDRGPAPSTTHAAPVASTATFSSVPRPGDAVFSASAAEVPPAVVTVAGPKPCTGSASETDPGVTSGPAAGSVSVTTAPAIEYREAPSSKPAPRSTSVPALVTALLSVGTICSSGWTPDPNSLSRTTPFIVVGTTSVTRPSAPTKAGVTVAVCVPPISSV